MPRRTGRRAQRPPRNRDENNNIVDVEINHDHSTEVRVTEDYFKSQKVVNDHCRRLNNFINWTHENYAEYYSQVVFELNDEQKSDGRRYYKSTHDL